jgi:transforming growth factor-beta-induced protein
MASSSDRQTNRENQIHTRENQMKRIITLFFALTISAPTWLIAEDNILTTAASNGSFNTLVSLVVAADLDDALQGEGEFTVFAPTDEAFAKLPRETVKSLLESKNREQLANILKYHVLPREISVSKRAPSHPLKSAPTLSGEKVRFERSGSKVKVNDANIVIRNIRCSNGIIHVIDAVLMPPEKENSIVGVAAKAGKFKTLLAAAEAAGLAEVLAGDGPLTVFAPTDEAFQALPKGKIENLLKPKNREELANLLKYHVVKGSVTAQQAVKAGSVTTLVKKKVSISIRDGRIVINDSNVISNDLKTSNGIIHVIDRVLMPSEKTSKFSTSTSEERLVTNSDEITFTADWRKSVDKDGVKADRIIIKVGGGGSVRLTNVEAREIQTNIGGGGRVTIDGVAINHNVSVSGGAVLRASNLRSLSTKIDVYGGGNAQVNASQNLKANVHAGATLRYVETDAIIEKSINKYASFGPLEMETRASESH